MLKNQLRIIITTNREIYRKKAKAISNRVGVYLPVKLGKKEMVAVPNPPEEVYIKELEKVFKRLTMTIGDLYIKKTMKQKRTSIFFLPDKYFGADVILFEKD